MGHVHGRYMVARAEGSEHPSKIPDWYCIRC
jgi:hypothetical protein